MSELPAEPVDLMTVSEVAALLRVSTMTVYRLVDAGLLRAIRIGRSLRLPRASVLEFIRDAENASTPEASSPEAS
jgi:excisionase family DNA binding protein